MHLNNYVVVVHFTKMPDYTTLKGKVEAKFDVIISNTVQIIDPSDFESDNSGFI